MRKLTKFSLLLFPSPSCGIHPFSRECSCSRPLCPQDSGASQNWNFENSEVEKHPGNPNNGHFRPHIKFSFCSGPARPGQSGCPPPIACSPVTSCPSLWRSPHVSQVWAAVGPGARPSSPALSCPHPRSSKTVNAPLLPPPLVTGEVLNPWGSTLFAKSGRASFKKELWKGLHKLCCCERSRVSGPEHTPACTRAQVHLSRRTQGQGACQGATLPGALNSLAVAGGDVRRWLGIQREFRNGLGKRGPENGDSKHTHRSVCTQSSSPQKAHTLENRPLWAALYRDPPAGAHSSWNWQSVSSPGLLSLGPNQHRAYEDGDRGAPGALSPVCRAPRGRCGLPAQPSNKRAVCGKAGSLFAPVPARSPLPAPHPQQPAAPNGRRGRRKPSEQLTPSFLLRIFT